MKNKKLLITFILSYFFIAFVGITNADSIYEAKVDKILTAFEKKYENKEIRNQKSEIKYFNRKIIRIKT